jgi:protein-L-isoaspartate(D-aspartate) O-methyltransferase
LQELGYENVQVIVGDGTLGAPEAAPFDAIVVTAAAPTIPPPLKQQLAARGRLVAPVGDPNGQYLEIWERVDAETWRSEQSIPVTFVPLVGKYGWNEQEWNRGRWWA